VVTGTSTTITNWNTSQYTSRTTQTSEGGGGGGGCFRGCI
tara:strand:+ start:161 stop:280 length:120 start_codon:yes stop_codon:yes gene_type:complete